MVDNFSINFRQQSGGTTLQFVNPMFCSLYMRILARRLYGPTVSHPSGGDPSSPEGFAGQAAGSIFSIQFSVFRLIRRQSAPNNNNQSRATKQVA